MLSPEERLEQLLSDTPRFGTTEIAHVAGVCERTVQRHLRKKDPHHCGPWRVTRRELLAIARELEK